MILEPVYTHKKKYLDLLLVGDEQESMLDLYLDQGEMFLLKDVEVKGVCVVLRLNDEVAEIKNVAIDPQFHRQGYGKKMMDLIANHYTGQYKKLILGTGDVPSTTLFYKSCGYVYSYRIKNFFLEHYDHPIVEDGIQLIDMVYFEKILF